MKKQILALSFTVSALFQAQAIALENPFAFNPSELNSPEFNQKHQQRMISKEKSVEIKALINKQFEMLKKHQDISVENIAYDEKSKQLLVSGLRYDKLGNSIVDPNLPDNRQKQQQEQMELMNSLNMITDLAFHWYDAKEIPLFYLMDMTQYFQVDSTSFFKDPKNKEMLELVNALKIDKEKFFNKATIAYEYNESLGEIKMSIQDNFNNLIQIDFVLFLDGVSLLFIEQMNAMYQATPEEQKQIGPLLFGQMSAFQLKKMMLKIKPAYSLVEIENKLSSPASKKDLEDIITGIKKPLPKEIADMLSKEQLILQENGQKSLKNMLLNKQPMILKIEPNHSIPFMTIGMTVMSAVNDMSQMAMSDINNSEPKAVTKESKKVIEKQPRIAQKMLDELLNKLNISISNKF